MMPLNFQYTQGENRHYDTERGRRGGRGRGGYRGGRGGNRGGDRRDDRRDDSPPSETPYASEGGFGGFSQTNKIQLEDDHEFPTLG